MIILGIDTSCDETSISILRDDRVLTQLISSQISQQNKWGGVVPMLAKRNHVQRIENLIIEALSRVAKGQGWEEVAIQKLREFKGQSGATLAEEVAPEQVDLGADHKISLNKRRVSYDSTNPERVSNLELSRLLQMQNPGIDCIAVTVGPGLAPALEVGIEAAKQLAEAWDAKVYAINHMEGHMWSGLLRNSAGENKYVDRLGENFLTSPENYPMLGLLVSGGHTEFVLAKSYGEYELVGEKLDDAAGEALDKFSVMLNFGYPGGAIVEKLAEPVLADPARYAEALRDFPLPIPMRGTENLQFSFSGLKTAALYLLRSKGGYSNPSNVFDTANSKNTTEVINLSKTQVENFCASFQHSVIEAIMLKVKKALNIYQPKVLLTGGGVISNNHLRKKLLELGRERETLIVLPEKKYLTDNASMIALVGYYKSLTGKGEALTAVQVNVGHSLDRRPDLGF